MTKLIYPESNGYFAESILAEHEGKQYCFDVELNTDENPDLKIGDFSNNLWFRTPYGIDAKKYTSVARMKKAVERLLTNKNFTNLEWISRTDYTNI